MGRNGMGELLALSMECLETVGILTWSPAVWTVGEYTRSLIYLLVDLEHRTTNHPKKARL